MQKIVLILSIITLFACRNEKTPMQMIQGRWQGSKWIIEGIAKEGMDMSVIKFDFRDSSYEASFAMMSETGSFNLRNNCFNAMSIYGSPKKCPILRLERDTMVWLMDSVGQPGHLYLVRVKD